MNFYVCCFFVIICLGAWVSPANIYLGLGKNRAGVPEETTKKLSENMSFPIIKGLVQMASQARSWVQWVRRLLKALRKWCNSHPPEVKLGKCFASYFNIKIPQLRHYEKTGHINEGTKETKYPREISKKFLTQSEVFGKSSDHITKIFKVSTPKKFVILLIKDFLSKFTKHLRHYINFIFTNDLVVCMWDYFWKKFWSWVDSAPDLIPHSSEYQN